jgi:hypothetical protein
MTRSWAAPSNAFCLPTLATKRESLDETEATPMSWLILRILPPAAWIAFAASWALAPRSKTNDVSPRRGSGGGDLAERQ